MGISHNQEYCKRVMQAYALLLAVVLIGCTGGMLASQEAFADNSAIRSETTTSKTVVAATTQSTTPVYRLYNQRLGDHHYTTDANERFLLVAKHGWADEGVAWYAPITSKTPVYRLYNAGLGTHHYTTDANERKVLIAKHGWRNEGIGWYSDTEEHAAIWRLFNPRHRLGIHHYTSDKNEYDVLQARHGWRGENIGWYAARAGIGISSLSKTSMAGNAVAASAVALAGSDGWAPAKGNTYTQRRRAVPPNKSAAGNWTVYNKVFAKLPKSDYPNRRKNHAECSQTVQLAVKWSGVDDTFSTGTTKQQYAYMAGSKKWKRVGVFNRITLKGVALQPGDVLVTTKCARGKYGHICIYVGNQYAQRKFAGTSGAVVESYEARYWPSITTLYQTYRGENNIEYYVFRPTATKLSTRYSSYLALEKQRYALLKLGKAA